MTDLRAAAEMVLEALEGMVNSNWRNWEELASPEEFERWVKSRANHSAEALRQALAQQALADNIRPRGKSILKVWVDELYKHELSKQRPVKSYTNGEPQYATENPMTDLRKAAEMALVALENADFIVDMADAHYGIEPEDRLQLIEALRQALAQPEQPMSPEHLPRYVATNGVKPMEGGGGGGSQPEQSKYSDIVSDGGLDPRNKFDAQQEPVAVIGNWGRVEWAEGVFPQFGDKMYAAPPKREWVGLTEEERDKIIIGRQQRWEIAHMIEAALRSKNNG